MPNSPIWTTKSGDRIRVTDMTDEHLLNTHSMIVRKGYIHTTIYTSMLSYNGAGEMAQHSIDVALMTSTCSPTTDVIFNEVERRKLI